MEKNLLTLLLVLILLGIFFGGTPKLTLLGVSEPKAQLSAPNFGSGEPRGVNLSNYTDLIVQNLTIYVNSGQLITVLTSIRNIGNSIATDSTTQLRLGTIENRLPTPFIRPGQTIALAPVEYSVTSGSSVTIIATADYLNNVRESNEYNNVATRTVIVN